MNTCESDTVVCLLAVAVCYFCVWHPASVHGHRSGLSWKDAECSVIVLTPVSHLDGEPCHYINLLVFLSAFLLDLVLYPPVFLPTTLN